MRNPMHQLTPSTVEFLAKATCILLGLFLFVGCESVQTSSGAVYLERYDMALAETGSPTPRADSLEAEIREAANIEPLLRFPARIGLARIEDEWITPVPQAELEAWAALAAPYQGSLGEFLPVSPLLADLTAGDREQKHWHRNPTAARAAAVRAIRLAAARQHMDAVLIYEVYGTGDASANPLAVADLSFIGAFLLPGRDIEVVGHASALLVDVRNGYPYGIRSATVEESAITPSVGSRERTNAMREAAEEAAALALVSETKGMMEELVTALAVFHAGS